MKNRSAACALALLSAFLALPMTARAQEPAPSPTPKPSPSPTITAKVSGGALVDYGQETGTSGTYTVRIETAARLSDFERGPRLRTLTDLTQLPGSSKTPAVPDVATSAFDSFQTIEFSAAVVQPIPKMRFALYAGAGFASRFNHAPNVPATKAPRWGCLGLVTFDPGSLGELSAAICRDQRLDDGTNQDPVPYQWAAEFSGRIDLKSWAVGDRQVTASLTGNVLLGLNATTLFPDHPELTGGRHDVLRAGVMLSYGR